jgi:hypothetical protein
MAKVLSAASLVARWLADGQAEGAARAHHSFTTNLKARQTFLA